jgi:hypothetical protein
MSFENLAVANAGEVVALRNRNGRRRIKAAGCEQRAVLAEDGHRRDLRIAAAHGAQLVVDLALARADAVVVEALNQIDDARIERFVHIEHFQRMFFRDPHGTQRQVGRVRFALPQVAEGHGRDIYARQHDRRDQQGDQRHAPDMEILFRYNREQRLVLPVSGETARFARVGPVGCHL